MKKRVNFLCPTWNVPYVGLVSPRSKTSFPIFSPHFLQSYFKDPVLGPLQSQKYPSQEKMNWNTLVTIKGSNPCCGNVICKVKNNVASALNHYHHYSIQGTNQRWKTPAWALINPTWNLLAFDKCHSWQHCLSSKSSYFFLFSWPYHSSFRCSNYGVVTLTLELGKGVLLFSC